MAGYLRGRDEGRKETAVLHKNPMTFDWPRSRKPIQVTLWMGNRGALTDVKNAHPSEFWIRIGFGWGRMGILPAVTMHGDGDRRADGKSLSTERGDEVHQMTSERTTLEVSARCQDRYRPAVGPHQRRPPSRRAHRGPPPSRRPHRGAAGCRCPGHRRFGAPPAWPRAHGRRQRPRRGQEAVGHPVSARLVRAVAGHAPLSTTFGVRERGERHRAPRRGGPRTGTRSFDSPPLAVDAFPPPSVAPPPSLSTQAGVAVAASRRESAPPRAVPSAAPVAAASAMSAAAAAMASSGRDCPSCAGGWGSAASATKAGGGGWGRQRGGGSAAAAATAAVSGGVVRSAAPGWRPHGPRRPCRHPRTRFRRPRGNGLERLGLRAPRVGPPCRGVGRRVARRRGGGGGARGGGGGGVAPLPPQRLRRAAASPARPHPAGSHKARAAPAPIPAPAAGDPAATASSASASALLASGRPAAASAASSRGGVTASCGGVTAAAATVTALLLVRPRHGALFQSRGGGIRSFGRPPLRLAPWARRGGDHRVASRRDHRVASRRDRGTVGHLPHFLRQPRRRRIGRRDRRVGVCFRFCRRLSCRRLPCHFDAGGGNGGGDGGGVRGRGRRRHRCPRREARGRPPRFADGDRRPHGPRRLGCRAGRVGVGFRCRRRLCSRRLPRRVGADGSTAADAAATAAAAAAAADAAAAAAVAAAAAAGRRHLVVARGLPAGVTPPRTAMAGDACHAAGATVSENGGTPQPAAAASGRGHVAVWRRPTPLDKPLPAERRTPAAKSPEAAAGALGGACRHRGAPAPRRRRHRADVSDDDAPHAEVAAEAEDEAATDYSADKDASDAPSRRRTDGRRRPAEVRDHGGVAAHAGVAPAAAAVAAAAGAAAASRQGVRRTRADVTAAVETDAQRLRPPPPPRLLAAAAAAADVAGMPPRANTKVGIGDAADKNVTKQAIVVDCARAARVDNVMTKQQHSATLDAGGHRLARLPAHHVKGRLAPEDLVAAPPKVDRRVPQRQNRAEAGGGAAAEPRPRVRSRVSLWRFLPRCVLARAARPCPLNMGRMDRFVFSASSSDTVVVVANDTASGTSTQPRVISVAARSARLLDQVASVGGISERRRVFRASSSSREAHQWAQARPYCVCQQLHLLRRARSSFTTMVPRMCALNTLTNRLHNDAGVLACC
ncbi:hypothetical protein BU14_0575s0014 [Porphyra umbilicalis]|uniref:Uncharacterized protein n=1 Tax=Porphyra umbilicalis TaxID=2786 RepID=A0A1X6NRL8_PORUM|nr:hypothetical protein BU14_0575s0014 [Porphyra umbilicalis]|eukprot:OSX71227.1 hypothetical protein BU14_0575s0014 [Porphyra umbilicalis]